MSLNSSLLRNEHLVTALSRSGLICFYTGVIPATSLLRNLGKRSLILCHHYLGKEAAKALALALKVYGIRQFVCVRVCVWEEEKEIIQ